MIRLPKKPHKSEKRVDGKWVFVPENELSEAEREEYEKQADDDAWASCLSRCFVSSNPFSALTEFQDLRPGSNKVPDDGAWITVTQPPQTEYTVPPFSIWFATPWDTNRKGRNPNRVKIVTPRGDLGLYPHEYTITQNPGTFFEFLGDGITAKFFGSDEGVPKEKLFYLRSRGISKSDAMLMLVGSINAHGVMWLETDRAASSVFYRGHWPDESRLATILPDAPKPQNETV